MKKETEYILPIDLIPTIEQIMAEGLSLRDASRRLSQIRNGTFKTWDILKDMDSKGFRVSKTLLKIANKQGEK